MANLMRLLAILLLAAAFAQDAQALKCFVCKECETLGLDQKTVACEKNEALCYIRISKTNFERGCALDSFNACPEEDELEDVVRCSTCSRDACNSASFIPTSVGISAMLGVIITLLR